MSLIELLLMSHHSACEFFGTVGVPAITGHAAIREWLNHVLAAGVVDFEPKVVATIVSGDLAVTHTDWRSH